MAIVAKWEPKAAALQMTADDAENRGELGLAEMMRDAAAAIYEWLRDVSAERTPQSEAEGVGAPEAETVRSPLIGGGETIPEYLERERRRMERSGSGNDPVEGREGDAPKSN